MHQPPSDAAARQRAYRQRQIDGEVMLPRMGLSRREIDTLHRLGYVEIDKLEDRDTLIAALHLLLASIRED